MGPVQAWPEVDDHIVAKHILAGVRVIRHHRGCGIPAALDEFTERYRWLRQTRPQDFTVGDDSYWDGFYS